LATFKPVTFALFPFLSRFFSPPSVLCPRRDCLCPFVRFWKRVRMLGGGRLLNFFLSRTTGAPLAKPYSWEIFLLGCPEALYFYIPLFSRPSPSRCSRGLYNCAYSLFPSSSALGLLLNTPSKSSLICTFSQSTVSPYPPLRIPYLPTAPRSTALKLRPFSSGWC